MTEAASSSGLNAPFLLVVDLLTFTVSHASPPLSPTAGVTVAVAGFTASDSALPAAGDRERLYLAYAQYGRQLSAQVLGQYAAVIVDTPNRQVLLLQDSLGVRPLFYRRQASELIVASDLDTLLGRTGPLDLDLRFFAQQLSTGERPHTATPFADVHKLAYGVTLIVDANGLQHTRPWQPGSSTLRLSLQDAAEQLRLLLDQAITACLPSKGVVLCELSGGLDSTTVFCSAVRLYTPLQALSLLDLQSKADDDEVYATAVLQQFPVPWHRIDTDAHPYYAFPQNRFTAEPAGEMFASVQQAYKNVLVASNAAVVLTGGGGDSLFGYGSLPPLHLADPLAAGRLPSAVRAAKTWAAQTGAQRPWTHIFREHTLRPALRHLLRNNLLTPQRRRLPGWVGPVLRKAAATRSSRHTASSAFVRQRAPSAQYFWESAIQLAAQVNYPFRLQISASTRHPLFHRPLVEFLASLPPGMRATATHDRILQRYAMRSRMPAAVCERRTKGSAQSQLEQAFLTNQPLRSILLDEPRIVSRGWVQHEPWKQQVERAAFGVFDDITSFESAAVFELWLRAYEEKYQQ